MSPRTSPRKYATLSRSQISSLIGIGKKRKGIDQRRCSVCGSNRTRMKHVDRKHLIDGSPYPRYRTGTRMVMAGTSASIAI